VREPLPVGSHSFTGLTSVAFTAPFAEQFKVPWATAGATRTLQPSTKHAKRSFPGTVGQQQQQRRENHDGVQAREEEIERQGTQKSIAVDEPSADVSEIATASSKADIKAMTAAVRPVAAVSVRVSEQPILGCTDAATSTLPDKATVAMPSKALLATADAATTDAATVNVATAATATAVSALTAGTPVAGFASKPTAVVVGSAQNLDRIVSEPSAYASRKDAFDDGDDVDALESRGRLSSRSVTARRSTASSTEYTGSHRIVDRRAMLQNVTCSRDPSSPKADSAGRTQKTASHGTRLAGRSAGREAQQDNLHFRAGQQSIEEGSSHKPYAQSAHSSAYKGSGQQPEPEVVEAVEVLLPDDFEYLQRQRRRIERRRQVTRSQQGSWRSGRRKKVPCNDAEPRDRGKAWWVGFGTDTSGYCSNLFAPYKQVQPNGASQTRYPRQTGQHAEGSRRRSASASSQVGAGAGTQDCSTLGANVSSRRMTARELASAHKIGRFSRGGDLTAIGPVGEALQWLLGARSRARVRDIVSASRQPLMGALFRLFPFLRSWGGFM
jgi:hypothetical protein